MAQATQPYRKSLSGSIGAGMKSILGGGGRTYYMLVHKVSSKYHKAGESQPIIVDEIEIGRAPQCQVRFDESFTTVSRRHAAIIKDGGNWKLVQLSSTNSTYLNGQKVNKEWYLQNGDEIQLSTNGPKLGFIVPEGDKGKVSSIGLTARLNLFRKQALRPYKTALTILGCVLVLAIAAIVYQLFSFNKQENEYRQYVQQQETDMKALEDSIKEFQSKYDTLQLQYVDIAQSAEKMKKQVGSMKKQVSSLNKELKNLKGLESAELKVYAQYVYYVEVAYIDIITPDGETLRTDEMKWSGSGFLLNDGSFVTARHVAKAWYHWKDNSTMRQLREKEFNEGYKIKASFIGVSSSGDEIHFTSDDFKIPSGYDALVADIPLCLGGANDWAYIPHLKPGKNGLKYNKQKSFGLEKNTKLTIMGFPFGFGVDRFSAELPVSEAKVANDKLENGSILTTHDGFEHGNSGGPVFYMNDEGDLEVIGLVSGGIGSNTGMVTPIGNLK